MKDIKSSCLFCSIISGTTPSNKIIERDEIIVIKDIAPRAPIHYLLIPKIHISNLLSFAPEHKPIAGIIFATVHELAQQLKEPRAFRLIMNNGVRVGQSVLHWHIHFLSGVHMTDF